MSNQLNTVPEYTIELFPGYEVKLKPKYVFDEKTATYNVQVPIDLTTPHGDVKMLLLMKEQTMKDLIKDHQGSVLRLLSLVKSHFTSFRPMMRRSDML